MAVIFATFLAGLSFFLTGIAAIKSNMQQLAGRRFRQLLARWTGHPIVAAVWGFLFGAITQSSTAVCFILVSVIASGLMTVAQALPIVAWANLGTAMLVLLAAVNINVAVLYLIGVAGLMNAFNPQGRLRVLAGALFGIGLLFLGLKWMKDAFAPLPSFPWFTALAAFLHGSNLACFVLGCLLRIVIQSSSAIAIIAIALAQSGLLTESQAMMMMFGTGAGVALAIIILGTGMTGVPRQVTLFQASINTCASVTLLAVFYIEKLTGLPLVVHLINRASSTLDQRLAYSFVALQTVCVLSALITRRRAPVWLEKFSPPTVEQDLSQPRYIHDHAMEDPTSALELVEKEIARLLEYVPRYLDPIREEPSEIGGIGPSALHEASLSLAGEVQSFLSDLVHKPLSEAGSEHLLKLERRVNLALALEENVYQIVQTVSEKKASPALKTLISNIVEALVTLLLSALDAVGSGDPVDIDILLRMTADRGDMMERLRRSYINADRDLAHQDRSTLFYVTSLFERGVWILHQLGLSLQATRSSDDVHAEG